MISHKLLRLRSACSIQNTAARRLAYVSNKKITRIPSDTFVDQSELETTGNEKYLNVNLKNRNPRNLEQMLLEPKPMGYEFDSPNRHFWNKVVFEKKAKYLTAKIVHHSGQVIIEASTNETPIAKHVNNPIGTGAAQILGKTLARRALECGVHCVFADKRDDLVGKSKTFLESFAENGIQLKEPKFIFRRSLNDH